MDLQSLKTDPEFMALPFEEKKKAIAMLDPSFKSLDPSEQDRGLEMIFPKSVSDIAAQRIASQGLTPSDVKAGKGITSPDSFTFNGLSLGDVGGAIGKGLAHFVGIPTSKDELKQAGIDAALNTGTAGIYGMSKQGAGMLRDLGEGHIPVIGRPIETVLGPAEAVGHGNAPTQEQNLNAIDTGTQLAASAAVPKITSAIMARGGSPLSESIGSQISGQSKYVPVQKPPSLSSRIGERIARGVAYGVAPFGTKGIASEAIKGTIAKPRWELQMVAGIPKIVESPGYTGTDFPMTAAQAEIPQSTGYEQPPSPPLRPVGDWRPAPSGGDIAEKLSAPSKPTPSEPFGEGEAVTLRDGGIAVVTKSDPLMTKFRMGKHGVEGETSTASLRGQASAVEPASDVKSTRFGHDEAVQNAINDAMTQAGGDKKLATQILHNMEVVYEDPTGEQFKVPYGVKASFFNRIK